MTVDDLMNYFSCKTQEELTEKIKVSRVTIWKWLKNGIPLRTQAFYEVQTKGALKADLEEAKTPSCN